MTDPKNDWRIRRTINLLRDSAKKSFSPIEVRKCYIDATGNASQTSFLDFLQRMKMFNLIKQDEKTKKISLVGK